MRHLNQMALVVAIVALTSVFAFADKKRDRVTFPDDIQVNGTVVKKGKYDVEFNNETSELSILKRGKVIAKAKGRLEPRDKKARNIEFRGATVGEQVTLVSLAFGGSNQNIVIDRGGEAAR